MKFFTKEVRIGLAAILTVVVLFYGINFLKGINLFKSANNYYVEFEDVCGLTVSSPVFADGYNVGIVRNIDYDKERPGHLVVEIEVDKGLRIPGGSTAELESTMLGGVNMNLLLANNPRQRIEPGGTIKGATKQGAVDMVTNMIPQFEKMLPKLDSILTSVNALLASPALAATLNNTEKTTANLDRATDQLNRLMTTLNSQMPQMMTRVNNISQNLEVATANFAKVDFEGLSTKANNTLGKMETLGDKLTSKDNSLGLLLNDPTLYNNMTRL